MKPILIGAVDSSVSHYITRIVELNDPRQRDQIQRDHNTYDKALNLVLYGSKQLFRTQEDLILYDRVNFFRKYRGTDTIITFYIDSMEFFSTWQNWNWTDSEGRYR